MDEWIPSIEYDVGNNQNMQRGRFGMQMHAGQTVRVWFEDHQIAQGCTDPTSPNYDREAIEDWGWALEDNGSCAAAAGCMDTLYAEYDPTVQESDPSQCLSACKDAKYKEYVADATNHDQSMCKTGCNDQDYVEYVADAVNHDQSMCLTLPVIRATRGAGITVSNLELSITEPGKHTVSIMDAHGKTVINKNASEPEEYRFNAFKPGIYFVEVRTERERIIKRVTLF
jgi:hypothetical protein